MIDWQDFCRDLDVGSLVPDVYERYRPAIIDAAAFFLANLSPIRVTDILADQAELADDAGVDERLVAIAHHCPALHKLGQVLARDPALPRALRLQLQRLETMPPRGDTSWARSEITRQLGHRPDAAIVLGDPPLAEASVALVVPFRWHAGSGREHEGVFKLLKPGIEEKLDEELTLLQRVGELLDERCHAYDLPEISYAETFAQVRELLEREVRLDGEQRHLRAARLAYRDRPAVVIPEVFPFSTPRMTAMERVYGRKVTDVEAAPAAFRRALAATMIDALLAHPIWAPGPSTLFHADPHAGNLIATDEGRLAILDWSLVGHLTKDDQVTLSQILLGALTSDPGRILQAIGHLADNVADPDTLRGVVDRALQRRIYGFWPGLTWLTDLMDTAAAARLRFGRDLVVFRKVLLTLRGVVADVCGTCRPDRLLVSAFLARLNSEWPRRLVAPPFSRDFVTHFSNAELMHLGLSSPLVAWGRILDVQQKLVARALPGRSGSDEDPGEIASTAKRL
jgi:ubiquinone biosynthesis protein